nr:sensor histidine kinase [Aurantimonas aggregata]
MGRTVVPEPSSENPVWDANRLRTATNAAGVGLWSWNIDADLFTMDERSHELWGIGSGRITFEDLSARIYPDDFLRVRAAFTKARKILGAYEADFRILHSDEIQWVSVRGMGDNLDAVGRIMFGVFLDITERMRAEEAREMLATEMGHRVKNLFAIAAALTNISARSTTTSAEMSLDLSRRLTALNKAHELVRPGLTGPGKAVSLGELLSVLLDPYIGDGGGAGRIRVAVPDLVVGDASTTTMALIVHELATNSLKYGALATETGSIVVGCVTENGDVTMTWTEKGGPPVSTLRAEAGFGSQLVSKSISNQLGGSIAYDWNPDGVIVTLRMRQDRLGA